MSKFKEHHPVGVLEGIEKNTWIAIPAYRSTNCSFAPDSIESFLPSLDAPGSNSRITPRSFDDARLDAECKDWHYHRSTDSQRSIFEGAALPLP